MENTTFTKKQNEMVSKYKKAQDVLAKAIEKFTNARNEEEIFGIAMFAQQDFEAAMRGPQEAPKKGIL